MCVVLEPSRLLKLQKMKVSLNKISLDVSYNEALSDLLIRYLSFYLRVTFFSLPVRGKYSYFDQFNRSVFSVTKRVSTCEMLKVFCEVN